MSVFHSVVAVELLDTYNQRELGPLEQTDISERLSFKRSELWIANVQLSLIRRFSIYMTISRMVESHGAILHSEPGRTLLQV